MSTAAAHGASPALRAQEEKKRLEAQGYRVTVLSDWSLMCISESALLQADQGRLSDVIQRRHAARWSRDQPRGLSASEGSTKPEAVTTPPTQKLGEGG